MASSSIDLLKRLVGFPTVSRDSNLALIEFVAAYLRGYGIDATIVPDASGKKANLYAMIGPADMPAILLSGHTDVVPVDGQAWASDPYELRLAEGKAFGRGTCDMKGFIACLLNAVPKAVERDLRRPIHIALSHDEEIGCVGVRRMLPHIAALSVRPAFCIVGEPTSMQVIIAHKGKIMGRVRCTGHEAHSSEPSQGLNAIHLACDMIAGLRRLQAEIESGGVRDGDYGAPFTTIHVGTIQGGTALNIVPRSCSFEFEIRHLPAENTERLLGSIRALAAETMAAPRRRWPEAEILVEILNAYPALDTEPSEDVVAFVRSLTGGNSCGKVPFGSEAGLFRSDLGIPTVVCGPGSLEQAHKPNEYIALDQLSRCDAFLNNLLDYASGRLSEPL